MNNDQFDTYMLDLPDESFFAVITNYLGPVESPFQKHDLLRNLQAFLLRPSTLDRIVSLISRKEGRLLGAISLLYNVDTDLLVRFFTGDIAPSAIRSSVTNLIDRLLIIRDGSGHLLVNPIFREKLRERVFPRSPLIPRVGVPPQDVPETPWFTFSLACALRSFLNFNTDPFTQSGSLKRRFSSSLHETFSGIFFEGDGGRFQQVFRALRTLGLLYRNDEGAITINHDAWEEFSEIPLSVINPLLWSAAGTDSVEEAFRYGTSISHLVSRWSAGFGTTRSGIHHLLYLAEPEGGRLVDYLPILKSFGVILDYADWYTISPASRQLLELQQTGSAILLQATLEITVTGTPSGTDLATLAGCSEILTYDQAPRYELTERSVLRAFRSRDGRSILPFLETLGPVPQNIRFQIGRWEEHAQAARLSRNTVLRLKEEEEHILLHSEEFMKLEGEKIADGVYIFPQSVEKQIIALLSVMEIPVGIDSPPTTEPYPEYVRYYGRLSQPTLFPPTLDRILETTASTSDEGREEIPSFLEEIFDRIKSSRLPENLRRELDLRIHRKLILFPEQLYRTPAVTSLSEAQGLDYLGKVRIIEQAAAEGGLLEIVTRNSTGAPEKILVHPLEIDKTTSDLILRARRDEDQKPLRIRIRKIALIRKLSGTLIRR